MTKFYMSEPKASGRTMDILTGRHVMVPKSKGECERAVYERVQWRNHGHHRHLFYFAIVDGELVKLTADEGVTRR